MSHAKDLRKKEKRKQTGIYRTHHEKSGLRKVDLLQNSGGERQRITNLMAVKTGLRGNIQQILISRLIIGSCGELLSFTA